jgi:hypothetical protein
MFIRSTSGTLKLCNLSFPGPDRIDNLWKAAASCGITKPTPCVFHLGQDQARLGSSLVKAPKR